MTKLADIPQFTQQSPYRVDQSWIELERWIERQAELDIQLNPDFQRGHVWTEQQQIAYCEYMLSGGIGARAILFNHPGWMDDWKGDFVLVDGLQRVTAARRFMRNEIPVFGTLLRDYEDKLYFGSPSFSIHVNNLSTRAAVLRWYLELNTGGVVHTDEEIDRVRVLLEKEK